MQIVIVGAGAAGISAAKYLVSHHPDLDIRVLEAASRPGGRALSVKPPQLRGQAVDLGCGWFHGSRDNLWLRLARELGYVIDETPAPWNDPTRRLVADKAAEDDAQRAMADFFQRVEDYDTSKADASWAAVTRLDDYWRPRFEMVTNMLNGATLAESSIEDYQHYDPGRGPDFRTPTGYGSLISAVAASLPIEYDTVVETIDHRNHNKVRIVTNRGTMTADRVIVTVSTTVLANERIRFLPALPAKTAAAAGLPLGKVNKLFLAVDGADDLPVDRSAIGKHGEGGSVVYQIRPFGSNAIEAYFGGQLAEDLERAGPEAAREFTSTDLAGLFGSSFPAKLSSVAMSGWCGDINIGGCYSYARPGCAGQRQILAEAVDERLFFAGEACSAEKFSTAHGAFETGVDAARAAVARIDTPLHDHSR
ncbi:MAG: FAD-dependent oxidoreductase [Rhizobiaceae bacterium]|nr:FAD-dependent oxidoreductase [Rhizobiaceae bacterium]